MELLSRPGCSLCMGRALSVAGLSSDGFRKDAVQSSCATRNSNCSYRRSLFKSTRLIVEGARTVGNLPFTRLLKSVSLWQALKECCGSSSTQGVV